MEKNKYHILVVDDDDGIRELVKQYLHLRLQALLKFKSMPLVFVPTFPSLN